MTGKPRKADPPPTPCGFPIGAGVCGEAATCELPAGAGTNSEPMPLCPIHAPRFLGAAGPLPSA